MGQSRTRKTADIDQLYDFINHILEGKKFSYDEIGNIHEKFSMYHGYKMGGLLNYILESYDASYILRKLNSLSILFYVLPEVSLLSAIPQSKAQSKDAFEHTLRVLNCVPYDDMILRWVALLHDIGKYDVFVKNNNFHNHQNASYELSKRILERYNIANADLISTIIKYHMYPLDYQRNPNWTNETVKKFIDDVDGEAALMIVDFACCDKRAEAYKHEEYLKPLLELKERIIHVLDPNIHGA